MDLNDLFQDKIEFYGTYPGVGDTFNVYRPNYNQVDNTPQLIAEGVQFRRDPATPQFSEPKLRNIEWYDIFGDRTILQSGDILIKPTNDGGQTPAMTFLHGLPTKATIGFRTARTCNLTNQFDDPVYTNVYFDFIGTGYPGSSINKKLEQSLQIPSVRVVLFKRNNLFRLRTQLIETDIPATITKDQGSPSQYQRKWKIDEIDFTGNIMILTLQQNLKD